MVIVVLVYCCYFLILILAQVTEFSFLITRLRHLLGCLLEPSESYVC